MISRTLLVLMLAVGVAPQAMAQSLSRQMHAARELYAAARYDEALALLDGLRPSEADALADRRAIEQYRSLCLLALGRATEAETAIAAVVTAEPFYHPSETDASPRVRAAFTEVRQRVLPTIAASQYAVAKRVYDRKEYTAAADEFRTLLRLLDDPDMKGQQADLRLLASGFLELSIAGSTPRAETAAAASAASAAVEPPPAPNRIYTQEDPGVTPALALKQDMPRVPASITSQVRDRGLVEVVIDEQGRVTFVSIRSSLHPMYDALLLTAAREWKYQPASHRGAAVKFRKLIQVSLARR